MSYTSHVLIPPHNDKRQQKCRDKRSLITHQILCQGCCCSSRGHHRAQHRTQARPVRATTSPPAYGGADALPSPRRSPRAPSPPHHLRSNGREDPPLGFPYLRARLPTGWEGPPRPPRRWNRSRNRNPVRGGGFRERSREGRGRSVPPHARPRLACTFPSRPS